VSAPRDAGVDAVVLAALPEEMQPLRAMLTDARRFLDDEEIWCGRCAGRSVALVLTGDGERNARAGAFAALRYLHPGAVLAIGVSGALSPELKMGDLLVGHQVMREQGDAWPASRSLIAAAEGLAEARPAALPWHVLRAISDEAGEELPALVNECLDDGGALRRAQLAVRLFRQPSALPRLLALHRRTRLCAEALAAAVASLLAGPLTEIGRDSSEQTDASAV
jgi:nucleoside phosphorylase